MTGSPGFTWGKKRVYSVLAKPAGSRSGGKLCTSLFPASETPEQALDRVTQMAVTNARFREVWKGYQFLVVDLSEIVEVTEGAVVQRHLNERVVRG